MKSRSQTLRRMAIGAIGLGIASILAACGETTSDDDVQSQLVTLIADSSGVSETDASCIVDQALDRYTLDELAALNGGDADPEIQEEVGRITLACLLESDNLDTLLSDDSESDSDTDTDDGAEDVGASGRVTTVGSSTNTDDRAGFCEASAAYWVGSNAVNHLDRSDPARIRVAFERLDERLDRAITLAPSAQLAEPPMAARAHLTVIHKNLAAYDYDWERFDGSQELRAITSDVAALQSIEGLLQEFLERDCGLGLAELQDRGRAEAADITAIAARDELDDEVPADGFISVADGSGRLEVEVPEGWKDVDETIGDGRLSLVIGPDAGRYDETWAIDGMRISVADASSPVDWRSPMYDTAASSECTLVSSEPYEDPLYRGWIDRYEDCGTTSTAVVVGATDENFTLQILVEVQFDGVDDATDGPVLQTILDTFIVR